MAKFLALIAAALSIALLAPIQAHAQTGYPRMAAPNLVVQRWVRAIEVEDYATAWSLMSAHSQSYVVKSVATEAKMDEGDVRALFDKNDPRVVTGYWASFRTASSALSKLTTVPASVTTNDGSSAIVQFDGYAKQWKCFLENGSWKVGMVETFIDP